MEYHDQPRKECRFTSTSPPVTTWSSNQLVPQMSLTRLRATVATTTIKARYRSRLDRHTRRVRTVYRGLAKRDACEHTNQKRTEAPHCSFEQHHHEGEAVASCHVANTISTKRSGKESATASMVGGGALRRREKAMVYQYPTLNGNRNVTIGCDGRGRKFIAGITIQLSVYHEKLDGLGGLGSVVEVY
jgi:hypothetical protein